MLSTSSDDLPLQDKIVVLTSSSSTGFKNKVPLFLLHRKEDMVGYIHI